MERHEFSSSNIASVEYDAETQVLTVEFLHDGETYRYTNVPDALFREMLNANTPGEFFYHYIRTSYPYVRVR